MISRQFVRLPPVVTRPPIILRPPVKNIKHNINITHVPVAALPSVDVSYFVGKSIILFTMFYCGLNWLHYRDLTSKKDD